VRNRHLWLFIGVYAACLAVLGVLGHPLEEALALLVIFGIAFPLLAWLVCLGAPAPTAPEAPRAGEKWLVVALFAYLALFLAFKGPTLDLLLPDQAGERLRDTVNTLLKLAAFVAVPLLAYRLRYGSLPDPGRSGMSRARLWLLFGGLGAALFGVTLVISRGTKELFGAEFSDSQRLVGFTLCFAWMALEAGIVEEVLFRWLLQSRVAALTGSQLSAVCLTGLAFGLAHAPGMWMRGAAAAEGLGTDPDLLLVVAYSVTTQGVAGLMLALLWARTRSLALVVGLHALIDASSNSASFIRLWGI
jgi:membrane protease YdiL (CAAX protease family)